MPISPDQAAPRIALFLPTLGGGGAERVLLNLAGGLAARGCRVDLVVATRSGELSDRVPETVNLVDLGAGRVLRSVRPLTDHLRKNPPAALLSALPHANLAAIRAWERAGRPGRLALSEHLDPGPWLAHASLRERLIFPPLMRRYYRRADLVIAVSQGVANGIARLTGLPQDKFRVIFNPVVPDDLGARARQPVDHAWLAAGGPPVILAVGRLTRQKDFPTLLRAFALLRRRRPARLILLGEGPDRPALLALAAELGIAGDVDLPGFHSNPYAFMARARVLALSTTWEGFGNVLAEGLACGAQVVSTDCPSGPAEILDGGKYGRLTPVGDPAALAAAIEQALDHPIPAERLLARGRDFSVGRITEQYLGALLPEGR